MEACVVQRFHQVGRREVSLDDEAASRVHSEILRKDGQLIVRDLKSTNGTYVNDARISESPLQNGDRIAVGDTVLLLQLEPKNEEYRLNLNGARRRPENRQ